MGGQGERGFTGLGSGNHIGKRWTEETRIEGTEMEEEQLRTSVLLSDWTLTLEFTADSAKCCWTVSLLKWALTLCSK